MCGNSLSFLLWNLYLNVPETQGYHQTVGYDVEASEEEDRDKVLSFLIQELE